MFPRSIRWRIQLWHGSLLMVLVAALILGFYSYERRVRLREMDTALHELIPSLVPRVSPPPGMRPNPERREGREEDGFERRPPRRRDVDSFGPPPDRPRTPRDLPVSAQFETGPYYYVAWSPQGELTEQSAHAPAAVPVPDPGWREGVRLRGEFREAIHRIPDRHMLVVGTTIAPVESQLQRLALRLTLAGIAVVGMGLVGGWWLTGRAIRPISDISAAAEKIAGGDLSRRINSQETESELGQLVLVLNRTFDRLESAFDQQARFTADASHELRTPLAVMLTQIQLALSRERRPEEYRQSLDICERAAERMRVLVNQLLELARVDSGNLELFFEPCDLGRVVREGIEFLTSLARQKNVTLRPDLEQVETCADTVKFGQVMINLLSNAIQHNDAGIAVSVSLKREGTIAVLRVSDNGAGIPQKDLPHLFERFYRVDKSRSRGKGHSGLGLAICKAIVEAHGGTIRVESQPGHGTQFTIELPIDYAKKHSSQILARA